MHWRFQKEALNELFCHICWWWWWWWWKALSLISSRDHCQRSSPSRIYDTPRAGFEPAQNLSSDFVEWSCAVVITTTPRCHHGVSIEYNAYCMFLFQINSFQFRWICTRPCNICIMKIEMNIREIYSFKRMFIEKLAYAI